MKNTQTYKDPEQGGQKIIVIGKPGCFSLGTKILMYDGLVKPVEKINTGDKVMGWDSTPRNVLELCRENDIMYTINPLKWESYTVNSYISFYKIHIFLLNKKICLVY
jgi:hypothetical protein